MLPYENNGPDIMRLIMAAGRDVIRRLEQREASDFISMKVEPGSLGVFKGQLWENSQTIGPIQLLNGVELRGVLDAVAGYPFSQDNLAIIKLSDYSTSNRPMKVIVKPNIDGGERTGFQMWMPRTSGFEEVLEEAVMALQAVDIDEQRRQELETFIGFTGITFNISPDFKPQLPTFSNPV